MSTLKEWDAADFALQVLEYTGGSYTPEDIRELIEIIRIFEVPLKSAEIKIVSNRKPIQPCEENN